MKIYCITSPNTELVYVGMTTTTLKRRMSGHRSHHKAYVSGKRPDSCSSYKVIECGDAVIELIEETDDSKREAHWIRELGACNYQKLELDWSDKATKAEYNRKYRMENIDACRGHQRKYIRKNRDEINRRQVEQIPCDHCGIFSSRVNMARHKKSQRCINNPLENHL